jgi:hypothetical protein
MITRLCAACCAALSLSLAPLGAQPAPPRQVPPVEKLGTSLFCVGSVRVDTARREVTVPGKVNQVTVLEFVANTRNGVKAYESAVTVDADAVTFNTALVLIGLDKSHARVPTQHFDPVPPAGDAVEIWIEWDLPRPQRMRIEKLLFDKKSGRTLPEGPWIYTGSTFLEDGRYLAELDGVLIGFVHSPAPIIENPLPSGVGNYGSIVLNEALGLKVGQPVRVIVKALPASGGSRP